MTVTKQKNKPRTKKNPRVKKNKISPFFTQQTKSTSTSQDVKVNEKVKGDNKSTKNKVRKEKKMGIKLMGQSVKKIYTHAKFKLYNENKLSSGYPDRKVIKNMINVIVSEINKNKIHFISTIDDEPIRNIKSMLLKHPIFEKNQVGDLLLNTILMEIISELKTSDIKLSKPRLKKVFDIIISKNPSYVVKNNFFNRKSKAGKNLPSVSIRGDYLQKLLLEQEYLLKNLLDIACDRATLAKRKTIVLDDVTNAWKLFKTLNPTFT